MDRITQAMQTVPRTGFLPPDVRQYAGFDEALPIGYGQTNSQPTTVRMMLDWLGPQPGDHILDIGSGSGWTTALLAYLAGPDGEVYAVERIPELVRFGQDNCDKLGIRNVRFFAAGDVFGLPDYAPYDKILVSASADSLPDELLTQLRTGGKLVIPVHDTIHAITKTGGGRYDDKPHPGFAFVPMLG